MLPFTLKHAEPGFENFPNFEIFRQTRLKTEIEFKGFDPLICSDGFIHAESQGKKYYISLLPNQPLAVVYEAYWCDGCGGEEFFNAIQPERLAQIKEALRPKISPEEWEKLNIDKIFEQAPNASHQTRPEHGYYPTFKEVDIYEKTKGFPYLYDYPHLCIADEETPPELGTTRGDIFLYTHVHAVGNMPEENIFMTFKSDEPYFVKYEQGEKKETTLADVEKIMAHLSFHIERKDVHLLNPLLKKLYQSHLNLSLLQKVQKRLLNKEQENHLSKNDIKTRVAIHSSRNFIYSGITGLLLTFGKLTSTLSVQVPTPPAFVKHAQIKKSDVFIKTRTA